MPTCKCTRTHTQAYTNTSLVAALEVLEPSQHQISPGVEFCLGLCYFAFLCEKPLIDLRVRKVLQGLPGDVSCFSGLGTSEEFGL